MIEKNPVEAVKNNIFGTKNLAEAAVVCGVSKFVLISTDKAVEPVSIYGATKMIAEKIILSSTTKNTEMIVVRFGNVLGSRGSIVPLFQKQIKKGGPLTITHPDIKRYFMTIPEASSLVLKAGGVGQGGNLYILDMGEPVFIKDMAEQMIKFYNFTPGRDIKITEIGLRPGEKLEEELWSKDEAPVKTEYPGIMKIIKNADFEENPSLLFEKLSDICFFNKENCVAYRNRKMLRQILKDYVLELEVPENEPEY